MKFKWRLRAQKIFAAQIILGKYCTTNVYMCVIFSGFLREIDFFRAPRPDWDSWRGMTLLYFPLVQLFRFIPFLFQSVVCVDIVYYCV